MFNFIKLFYLRFFKHCKIGKGVKIYSYANIYGCEIGDYTQIGSHTTIQRGAIIGSKCKIGDFTFIPDGTIIGNECFVGAGTKFCNDKLPAATNDFGDLKSSDEWDLENASVGNKSSIGINCTILPNVVIGDNVLIGAGSVVTKNVPSNSISYGNPAKVYG